MASPHGLAIVLLSGVSDHGKSILVGKEKR